ncbi:endolytic transglycosylase MltG [Aquicoccus sp. SCR17]|nr:endolytic transglycosylase MltG [Carideicomes alvinocaridis]
MWRSVASNALTFLILGLFLLAGLILWGRAQYTAEGPLDEAICVRVESGSNMDEVSRDLAERGAITRGSIFRIGADYTEKTGLLKAGSFRVESHASMADIVDAVTRGGRNTCGTEVVYRIGVNHAFAEVRELDPITNAFVEKAEFDLAQDERPEAYATARDATGTEFRLVLAEGVTSWQVMQALNAIDVLSGSIAEPPAEGTLAPREYRIDPGEDSATELVDRMITAQEQILTEAWAERDEDLPVSSPEEALILASIIEKETGVPEERRQVASVFVNRLKQGMRLQTDPTVIYGLTNGEGVLGRGLRQSELRKATPYNTYVIDGLPPTPIANPGRASIEAAVNPAETDYVFFVADGSGGHAFAETLDEHNRNVAKWRQLEAEQGEANGN